MCIQMRSNLDIICKIYDSKYTLKSHSPPKTWKHVAARDDAMHRFNPEWLKAEPQVGLEQETSPQRRQSIKKKMIKNGEAYIQSTENITTLDKMFCSVIKSYVLFLGNSKAKGLTTFWAQAGVAWTLLNIVSSYQINNQQPCCLYMRSAKQRRRLDSADTEPHNVLAVRIFKNVGWSLLFGI